MRAIYIFKLFFSAYTNYSLWEWGVAGGCPTTFEAACQYGRGKGENMRGNGGEGVPTNITPASLQTGPVGNWTEITFLAHHTFGIVS